MVGFYIRSGLCRIPAALPRGVQCIRITVVHTIIRQLNQNKTSCKMSLKRPIWCASTLQIRGRSGPFPYIHSMRLQCSTPINPHQPPPPICHSRAQIQWVWSQHLRISVASATMLPQSLLAESAAFGWKPTPATCNCNPQPWHVHPPAEPFRPLPRELTSSRSLQSGGNRENGSGSSKAA